MEHELIDWYDEKGKHKGVIDKAIAHKKGLWHKSVHVWIINSNDEVLLQKRCAQKSFYPNFWDCSFAGHVGAGEASIISAIREGEEELGIKVQTQDLEFLFTNKEELIWEDTISKEFVDVYIMRKNIEIENLKYQIEEVESAKYFKLDELLTDKRKSDILPHDEEYKLLKEILLK